MAVSSALSLLGLDQRQGTLQRMNRLLLGLLPLLILFLGWDLFHWVGELQRPVEPAPPSLAGLQGPPENIPALNLSESLFTAPQPVAQKPQAAASVSRPQWKVKGILMGTAPRAFLEDPEGKEKLWVTEGQQVGAFKVQKIKERSVLFESEGAAVEIPL